MFLFYWSFFAAHSPKVSSPSESFLRKKLPHSTNNFLHSIFLILPQRKKTFLSYFFCLTGIFTANCLTPIKTAQASDGFRFFTDKVKINVTNRFVVGDQLFLKIDDSCRSIPYIQQRIAINVDALRLYELDYDNTYDKEKWCKVDALYAKERNSGLHTGRYLVESNFTRLISDFYVIADSTIIKTYSCSISHDYPTRKILAVKGNNVTLEEWDDDRGKVNSCGVESFYFRIR